MTPNKKNKPLRQESAIKTKQLNARNRLVVCKQTRYSGLTHIQFLSQSPLNLTTALHVGQKP